MWLLAVAGTGFGGRVLASQTAEGSGCQSPIRWRHSARGHAYEKEANLQLRGGTYCLEGEHVARTSPLFPALQ